MRLADLPTPALVVDPRVVERNTRQMAERMRRLGVRLRPHLKTAKSVKVAKLATRDHFGGITVSTLREARYFTEQGFRDVTYAVPIAPGKLAEAGALLASGVELTVITDGLAGARALAEHAGRDGVRWRVQIEVDCGDARSGLPPDDPELLEVAEVLSAAPGVDLSGVLTHAGHSYRCRSIEEIREVARAERDAVVQAAQRLRRAGHTCDVVSAGSTPTAVHAQDLSGVTEMRPGVYVFFDLKQLSLGACTREQLALSVIATVIAHHRRAGHLVIDAGALALSKDVSANETGPGVGYGEVCDLEMLDPLGLTVRSVSQEHGVVPVASEADFTRLPVGARLRVLPNHACLTAAAYDHYHVIEGAEVMEQWERINGW